MSERVGAAKRRRDRWLRAWHRHKRLTVAMELATALHNSAQRPKTVVEVPREVGAASLGHLADRSFEVVLGAYQVVVSCFWTYPDFWDAGDLASEIGEDPCVWTNGSRACPTGSLEVTGAAAHLPATVLAMQGAVWEHGDAGLDLCRSFMPVPGQTVQRAEFRGVILALQDFWLGHLGIGNLNVG